VSKRDLSFANEKLLNIADCLQKIQHMNSPETMTIHTEETTNSNVGKTHLIQTINSVHGQITYPASLLSLFLLGEDDFFVSHNTKPLDILPLCHFMEHHGDVSDMTYSCGIFLSEDNDMQASVSEDSLKRYPPFIEDYLFRDPSLAHICPLLFYMFFEKRKQDQQFKKMHTNSPGENPSFAKHRGRPFNLRYRLQSLHCQSSTHMIVQRSQFIVQQLFSNCPLKPNDDSDDFESKHKYASFALALCAPFWLEDIENPQGCWLLAAGILLVIWKLIGNSI